LFTLSPLADVQNAPIAGNVLFIKLWNRLVVADSTLRQDAGNFMLGKYLIDKKIPLKRRRRLGMAVAGITPTASFLIKMGKMQSAGCRLCRLAREA